MAPSEFLGASLIPRKIEGKWIWLQYYCVVETYLEKSVLIIDLGDVEDYSDCVDGWDMGLDSG